MARYDYKCPACGTTFEVEHPMSAHPKVSCPKCGHEAQQVFEPYGINFKGSGFYNTDQRDKKSFDPVRDKEGARQMPCFFFASIRLCLPLPLLDAGGISV